MLCLVNTWNVAHNFKPCVLNQQANSGEEEEEEEEEGEGGGGGGGGGEGGGGGVRPQFHDEVHSQTRSSLRQVWVCFHELAESQFT